MVPFAAAAAAAAHNVFFALQSDSNAVPPAAASAAPKRKRRRTGPKQEGTYIGGGCRMMCYCPKHSHATSLKTGVKLKLPSEASAASLDSSLMRSQCDVPQRRAQRQASGAQAESAHDPAGKLWSVQSVWPLL